MNNLSQLDCEFTFRQQIWADEQKLPAWQRLLEAWTQVHKKYCCAIPGDNAWYYLEHPSRGLLAVAAFLAGGVSLQEWAVEKNNFKSGLGRNDLWLRLIPQSFSADFYIEAKHCRIDLESSLNSVQKEIDRASNAAKELERSDAPHVAVLFASLVANLKTSNYFNISTASDKLVRLAKTELHCDACAALWFDDESLARFSRKRAIAPDKFEKETVGVAVLAKKIY